MKLVFPENYDPRLSVRETQEAIKYIRDTFQKELGKEMNLERISAPLFVEKSSGLNDNLSGTERPVQFDVLRNPRRDHGGGPLPGQVEAHGVKGIRLRPRRGPVHQHERYPPG